MKKIFFLVLTTFYKYYKRGSTRDIAYESAILALSLFLFINLFTFFSITSIDSLIFLYIDDEIRFYKFIKVAILMAPPYLLLRLFFKEDHIKKSEFDGKEVKFGKYITIFYVVFSVLSMFITMILKYYSAN